MAHPTADKNFRLPPTAVPSRYAATLALDPAKKAFSGAETIALSLSAPSQEIVLHAIDLDLDKVSYRAAGRALAANAIEPAPASETVILRFPEPLPAGEGFLDLAWKGRFSAGLRGLYQAGTVAVTQFEAADARRLFPCFDEPSFKAAWALTLKVPKGLAALSNGSLLEEAADGDSRRIAFRETPKLSSYLVALACGNLVGCPEQKARGVPVRTWSVPEKQHLTAFGQEVAVNVLPRLEDYFGLPYAFGKVDQVGIPDFEAGAMENAGLITYREVALLLDPATASLPVKKRVAEVVTHELSHQWFGNWVTMVWWDDLWLNEAFATWMAYKIVDGWKPEWRVWLDFDAGKAAALHLDALRSTHPIRAEVRNAAEATESFDAITYEKGGAVLRMIEGYLGEEKFREGIRAYMKKHAQANATADDLWSALAAASRQPVVELANAWIRQSGHPLVSVENKGNEVKLTQRRFFSEPGVSSPERWPVPMVLRFQDARGIQEQRVLLRESAAEVALEAQGEVAWLCANAGATGFYRVAYDEVSLARLAKARKALATAERVALLADPWALVRAGAREVGAFLDLAQKFGDEEDYAVLDELVNRLSVIEHRLVPEADRDRFSAFIGRLLGAQFQQLGWDAKGGEGDAPRLRRAALVRALGLVARHPQTVSEAGARLDRFFAGEQAAIEPNLQDAAVAMAARAGDAARFDTLLRRFREETDPAFKRRYLMALASFEDPALAERAQELAFTDTVPMQEIAAYVATLLANRTAREGFWAKLQERWDQVVARAGGAPMLFRRIIEAFGHLPERRHYEQVSAFLAAHPTDAAKQAAAQTLERMRQDVELRERALGNVGAWLQAHA